MEKRENEVLELIKLYLEKVAIVHDMLFELWGEKEPMAAYVQGRIPRKGKISELQLEYSFHGIGCYVKGYDFEIDYDYGFEQRINIFNPERVFQFSKSINRLTPLLDDIESITKAFKELEHFGIIQQSLNPREYGSWTISDE